MRLKPFLKVIERDYFHLELLESTGNGTNFKWNPSFDMNRSNYNFTNKSFSCEFHEIKPFSVGYITYKVIKLGRLLGKLLRAFSAFRKDRQCYYFFVWFHIFSTATEIISDWKWCIGVNVRSERKNDLWCFMWTLELISDGKSNSTETLICRRLDID